MVLQFTNRLGIREWGRVQWRYKSSVTRMSSLKQLHIITNNIGSKRFKRKTILHSIRGNQAFIRAFPIPGCMRISEQCIMDN